LVAALGALGPGDVLLVAKRDRLARGRDVIAVVEKVVRKGGARLISAAGVGTAGDTPADRLTSGIVDLFAEFELDLIRTRTRAGLDAKRRRGERTGGVPYGWSVDTDPSGPQSKTGRLTRLVPVPAEQDGLKLLRSLAAQGLTARKIAVALNAGGYRTKTGVGVWRHQGVAKILGAKERGATNGG
jgi:DNA invertase Pin-like site-specific DNA recombinase